jgi:2-keto-3-deoxy-L-rhamnonate aldolase RhmA
MGLRAEEIGKNPEHERQLMRVLEGCQAVGKPAGLPVPDAAAANKWISRGFQMIDLANDLALLRKGVRSQLAAVKR